MPEEDNVLKQLQNDFPAEEELEKTDDVFGIESGTPGKESIEEILPDELKNRHIRRLEAKLTREREANIEFAAREAARSEYEKFSDKTKGLTVDERLVALYGDNENGHKAAKLTQSLLEDAVKRGKEEALSEFESRQMAQAQEVEKYGDVIEEGLEAIEDDYNVDLSGSTEQSKQTRKSFLAFVGKLSPKDADGQIESYADFDSAWDLFQERLQKGNTRQKDLASRGTVKSTSAKTVSTQTSAAEQYLKDQGII